MKIWPAPNAVLSDAFWIVKEPTLSTEYALAFMLLWHLTVEYMICVYADECDNFSPFVVSSEKLIVEEAEIEILVKLTALLHVPAAI